MQRSQATKLEDEQKKPDSSKKNDPKSITESILLNIEKNDFKIIDRIKKLIDLIHLNHSIEVKEKGSFIVKIVNVLVDKRDQCSDGKKQKIQDLLIDITQLIDTLLIELLQNNEIDTASNPEQISYKWLVLLRQELYTEIYIQNDPLTKNAILFGKAFSNFHKWDVGVPEGLLDKAEPRYECALHKILYEKIAQKAIERDFNRGMLTQQPNPVVNNKQLLDEAFMQKTASDCRRLIEAAEEKFLKGQYIPAVMSYKIAWHFVDTQIAKLYHTNLREYDRDALDDYKKGMHSNFFGSIFNVTAILPSKVHDQKKTPLLYRVAAKQLYKQAIAVLEVDLIPAYIIKAKTTKTDLHYDIYNFCVILYKFYRFLDGRKFLSSLTLAESNQLQASEYLVEAQEHHQAKKHEEAKKSVKKALQYSQSRLYTLMEGRVSNITEETKSDDSQANLQKFLQEENEKERRELQKLEKCAIKAKEAEAVAAAKKIEEEKKRLEEERKKQEAEQQKAAVAAKLKEEKEKKKAEEEKKRLAEEQAQQEEKRRKAEETEKRRAIAKDIKNERRKVEKQHQEDAKLIVSSRMAILKALSTAVKIHQEEKKAETEIKIPNEIKDILSKLEKAGYQAYLCGSAVMQLLAEQLGIPLNVKHIKDYDIATNAPDHVIKQLFPNFKLQKTLLKKLNICSFTAKKGKISIDITVRRAFIKLCQHQIISAPNLNDPQNKFVAGMLSVPNYA